MNTLTRFASGMALSVLLGACSSLPVELGSRSAQPRPAASAQVRGIEAKACGLQLAFLSLGIDSRQQRAYQGLLAQAAGDTIADVQMEESWFGLLIKRHCTTLRAKAYRQAS